MRYLIDSDWTAEYLKGRATAVTLLDRLFVEGLAISIVTFAEIYEGVYYGANPRQNEVIFRRFLGGVPVLPINRSVARRFARIRGELRGRGQLIPQTDLFIAATALSSTLTLVTRNTQHFRRIPNLAIYDPT